MNTDPISDMLTRIRNAASARKESVEMPLSSVKRSVAEILKREGFLTEVSERPAPNKQGVLELRLAYDQSHVAVISGIKRVSKPGLRRYMRSTEIPKIRNGLGILVLTTSKGMMTDKEARKAGIGGEAICAVW